MIALCYGITYIWGTVGIILICKYLPRWWGVDAKAAAKEYEAASACPTSTTPGSPATARSGCAPTAWRTRQTRRQDASRELRAKRHPQYRDRRTCVRGGASCWAPAPTLGHCATGDIIALGRTARGPDRANMGLHRPGGAGPQGARTSRSTRPRSWSPTRSCDGRRSRSSATRTSPARSSCSASSAAACRSRSGPTREAAALRRAVRRRPQERRGQGRRACSAGSRGPARRPTC